MNSVNPGIRTVPYQFGVCRWYRDSTNLDRRTPRIGRIEADVNGVKAPETTIGDKPEKA
jgi:hypothetical protein